MRPGLGLGSSTDFPHAARPPCCFDLPTGVTWSRSLPRRVPWTQQSLYERARPRETTQTPRCRVTEANTEPVTHLWLSHPDAARQKTLSYSRKGNISGVPPHCPVLSVGQARVAAAQDGACPSVASSVPIPALVTSSAGASWPSAHGTVSVRNFRRAPCRRVLLVEADASQPGLVLGCSREPDTPHSCPAHLGTPGSALTWGMWRRLDGTGDGVTLVGVYSMWTPPQPEHPCP